MKFLEGYTYLMRFDDDISVLSRSTLDVFADMQLNDIRVGKFAACMAVKLLLMHRLSVMNPLLYHLT